MFRRGLRRVLAPVWFLLVLGIGAASLPLVVAGALALPRLPRRWCGPVRLFIATVGYLCIFDCGALAGCLVLWIASGFGRRLGGSVSVARHVALNRRLSSALCWTTLRLTGLPVSYRAPSIGRCGIGGDPDAPLVVFPRHVGAYNVIVVPYVLTRLLGRPPRLVVKTSLAIDPAIDILWRRLGTVFIPTGGRDKQGALAAIDRVCRNAGRGDVVVIFPEGTSFTSTRLAKAVEALRRHRLHWQADRARCLRHMLPPRLPGSLAALAAAPGADVVFLAHTGIASAATLDRAIFDTGVPETLAVRCWRVPAKAVPRTPDRQARWLYAWWEHIDEWVERRSTIPWQRARGETAITDRDESRRMGTAA